MKQDTKTQAEMIEDAQNGIFIVEAIVGHKAGPRPNTFLYLVKWEDYPESENTWEPASHLQLNIVTKRMWCQYLAANFTKEES